ncbi:MAG TPA: hypothetical protein PL045_01280 [Chitinophagaceae bacterium]|nr:hypothetical protein [Chitinophagaceae bacterium]
MPPTRSDLFIQHLQTLLQDAVVWKAHLLYDDKLSPDKKEKGVAAICEMLCCITSAVKREAYIELLAKELKIKKGLLSNSVSNKLDEIEDKKIKSDDGEALFKLPDWCNKNRVFNYGLDWKTESKNDTGYYFTKRGNEMEQLTNFVLTPLFHIYDRTGGNRRLARLHNHINQDKLIELPSKAFISLDKFEELLADEGYYQTLEGFSKPHLKRLFRAIGNDFPKTYELKVLGWQPEGFWSYSDAIFDGQQLHRYNDIGVCKVRELFYYSPASSSLYLSERRDDDGREVMDDDPYENDKYLRYQNSPVTFDAYCRHLMLMHGDAGMPLICYSFVSLFKDIITAYEKVPLLYGYGIVQSGKSTWAEALFYLFYDHNAKPFNLNQGTVYAFFNRMERFRNCPQLFNEFDEDAIEDEFFRAFKSFYDGEGRDRGKGIKGKTETQKINCTVILVGQTLTTKDGASVLIRSVPVKFQDPGERSDKEKENYDAWLAWINKGVNSCLTDVLQHRRYFREHFFKEFNAELQKLKAALRESGDAFKERIAKNYCILLACGKVMQQQMNLGFTYQQLFDYCRKNIISLSRMISEVDNLATFWKSIEFFYEKGDVMDECDFILQTENEVRRKIDKDVATVPFDKATKILYLRLTKAYPYYAKHFRDTKGQKPINESTLITYFESSKSYLGQHPGKRFKTPDGRSTSPTSCYMFLYDKIGINLEREDLPKEDMRKPAQFECFVSKLPETIDAGGVQKLMFSVKSYETVKKENSLSETKTIYTKCFSNELQMKDVLFIDSKIIVLGMLEEKPGKNGYVNRVMEVEKIQLGSAAAADATDTF